MTLSTYLRLARRYFDARAMRAPVGINAPLSADMAELLAREPTR